MSTCVQCGEPLSAAARGRRPRYCSRACQARAYRTRTAERAASPPTPAPAPAPSPARDISGTLARSTRVAEAGAEPREPRDGLSTGRIVRTAIRIADTEGLDALSMRRVAAELDAGTMSLYRYVPGKDTLIELMVEAVFAESAPPDPVPGGWRAGLELAARREWAMYSRHPWVLRVIATPQPPLGPNVLADVERSMRAVDGLGLDPMTMHWVAIMVSAQVQGSALLLVNEVEAERRTGVTTRQWRALKAPMLQEILESGRFPMLSRLHEERGDAIDLDEWFEFGLRRLLDGLTVLIESRRTGPPHDEPPHNRPIHDELVHDGPVHDEPSHDVAPAGTESRGDPEPADMEPGTSDDVTPRDSEAPPQARSLA
ncbi:TetR/AcrR family transcriptional regulator [Streptosporangium sp. NBC_01469]|uniref:TetR/AcrR family transcriptional regulator n=1 Tax=Streptosporangium sp. NBC_01469 TaxID=2903898 RepID=UPI002E2C7DC6|nr:TetR/AcrR family transcriptional regulator [Streptosporangium sp. NBC_01469]